MLEGAADQQVRPWNIRIPRLRWGRRARGPELTRTDYIQSWLAHVRPFSYLLVVCEVSRGGREQARWRLLFRR